jgi:hypothetical protein
MPQPAKARKATKARAHQPMPMPVRLGRVISPRLPALIQASMPGVNSAKAVTPASMPSAKAMPSLRPVAMAEIAVPGQ